MKMKMNKNVRIAVVLSITVLSACLLASCPEIGEEPSSLYALVELLPGSPGYEGNEAVYGLLNGSYLVKHQKKLTQQDKDPEGRIRIWHEEDWYAVDGDGLVSKIASSTSEIPASATNAVLENGEYVFRGGMTAGANALEGDGGSNAYESYHANRYTSYAVNTIKGLVNGEAYGVYRYGELSDGNNIGRYNGELQTEDVNTAVNLKGLLPGQSIGLFDTAMANGGNGLFNRNNHLLVLAPTGLYWTKAPQVVYANIRLRGYDCDIIIEDRDSTEGRSTVSAVEFDGQQYFILTGTNRFTGFIKIVNKQ
jgi:hypothetical protein